MIRDGHAAKAMKSSARPAGDSQKYNRKGIEILFHFHSLIKTARLYQHNNIVFREQLWDLFKAISSVLQTGENAVFRLRRNMMFFNGHRIRFVLSGYPIFKFAVDVFRNREIGVLGFKRGLTVGELETLATVLAQQGKKDRIPYEDTLSKIIEAGLEHTLLEKLSPDDSEGHSEKAAVRVFFLSLIHLKDAFSGRERDEPFSVNTTRRLIQAICNNVANTEAFILGLTNIKNHDEYTLNHSVNVCMLSIALGRRLGLSKPEIVDLGISAFFHDIGKMATPIEILNKPARLDDREREIMERHSFQGVEKLMHLQRFQNLPLKAFHVALEHHIREDRGGYPRYFQKNNVNLFSKIVKVVDYFDAITTKRVYRSKVFTRAEALSNMAELSGAEFHPLILRTFITMMGTYPVGSLVSLDTGEIGIVFDLNMEKPYILRPRVKIIADSDGNKIDGPIADLSEKDPGTGRYLRTILMDLDPDKYGIRVPDYFLALAQ